ncbi:MAG: YdaU family protein [Armatimonadota bacterium]|nr:YdaU family protein [Armatimonadota bacterium]
MNFYKHHLGDYASHTAHLSWDEDCAYTKLLRAYYSAERALPLDDIALFRLIRADKSHQKIAIKSVLSEFFTLESDGYHNKRADEEITKYQAQASTNRRIARERIVNEPSTNRTPNQIPEPEPEPERSKPLAPSDKQPPVNGTAIAFIPLVNKTEFGVTAEYLKELETAYPAVDGPATLREIRAWCISNPRQCKTQRGVTRFLNRWFEKVQNHG